MSYKALDTMTCDLVKTSLDESLENAFLKMKKNKIRHLPVTDDLNRIVGIISDRDIYKGMQPGTKDIQSYLMPLESIDFNPKALVRDYMSWPIKTIPHNTDLKIAIKRMIDDKVSSLLVTYGASIVGIVTSEDLLRLLYDLLGDKYLNKLTLQQQEEGWIGHLLGMVK